MNSCHLTDKQSKELDRLGRIINFGADCLFRTKIDCKRIRIRKELLFLMMIAAHNYTEGIYVLCKESRTHCCYVLIRSLIENRNNAKSLFTSKTFEEAYRYLIYSYTEEKKMLEGVLRELKKRPAASQNQFISERQLIKKIELVNKITNKIKKKFSKKISVQSFYSRTKNIDDFNKMKNYKSASFIFEYETFYRLFSSNNHLNKRGLDELISVGKDGIFEIFLSGNPNNLEFIVQYTCQG